MKIKPKDPNSKVKIIGKELPSEFRQNVSVQEHQDILKKFIKLDNEITKIK